MFETRGGAPIRALKYNFIYNVKSENSNQLKILCFTKFLQHLKLKKLPDPYNNRDQERSPETLTHEDGERPTPKAQRKGFPE